MSISFKILSYAERTASLFIGTGALVAGATTYRPEGSGTVDIFDTSLMIHLDAYLMRIDELLGSTNSSGLIDFLMTYPQHIQSEEFSQFFVQNGYGGFKLGSKEEVSFLEKFSYECGDQDTLNKLTTLINNIVGWPPLERMVNSSVKLTPSLLQSSYTFAAEAVGVRREEGESRDSVRMIETNMKNELAALIIAAAQGVKLFAAPSNPMSNLVEGLTRISQFMPVEKRPIIVGPGELDRSRAEEAIITAVAAKKNVDPSSVTLTTHLEDGQLIPGAMVLGLHTDSMVVSRECTTYRIDYDENNWESELVKNSIPLEGDPYNEAELSCYINKYLQANSHEILEDQRKAAAFQDKSSSQKGTRTVIKISLDGNMISFSRDKLADRLKSEDATWFDVVIATKYGGAIDISSHPEGKSNMVVAASMIATTESAAGSSTPQMTSVAYSVGNDKHQHATALTAATIYTKNGNVLVNPVNIIDVSPSELVALNESMYGTDYQQKLDTDFSNEKMTQYLLSVKTSWDDLKFIKVPERAVELLNSMLSNVG
ncbi:hypothetical protein HOG98_02925 [bacterium]|jgi:hypothetical protein|nr:hypothetical protein [bacterium]